MKNLLFLFIISISSYAQNDSINLLDEVKLHGNFSKKLNAGFNIQTITDSVINSTTQSLGDLLQQHANIYFKEHGNGMVKSISFRGSSASHTGVYWNSIAINSALNGQTDFNTLSANGFNQVEIRKGAGSTLFGSGAIGGAINLKDNITFIKKKQFRTNIGLASYNTQNLSFQSVISDNQFYIKVNIEGEKADNEYPFLDTEIYNENAAYKNYQIKSALAYKLNQNNQIKLFTNYSNNYRELSRTITAPSNNLYKNTDNRLLLNWSNTGFKHNANLNLAILSENYKFYLDKNIDNYSSGETDSYLLKYDFDYFLKKNQNVTIGIENRLTKGIGSSIQKKERNIFETYIRYHQKTLNKLTYNLSLRKGFSNVYEIPLIYALDARLDISTNFNLRANHSSNYKLPTFNDLYWEISGNEELLPENSISSEIGFYYQSKKLNTNIAAYQIKNNNLIQWQPVTSTLWQPNNVQSVTQKGLEFEMDYQFKIKQHQFKTFLQYSLTKAIDNSSNKQLIYVPVRKATGNLSYLYKGFNFNYNQQYTSHVFTTTTNTQYLEKFWISNIRLNKTILHNTINIGFYINNLLNKNYQIVAYRPMPNRNYKLNINIKF